MAVDIKLLTSNDVDEFSKLIHLFSTVFEMDNFVCPSPMHLSDILKKPHFFAFAAFDGFELSGGLTGYILDAYYDARPYAYIFDLAVLPDRQLKGLGKLLVEATIQYAREKNCQEVFVQADTVDEYAINFYRKTRPTAEEDVIHFYYSTTFDSSRTRSGNRL